jgi:hypothetical protein
MGTRCSQRSTMAVVPRIPRRQSQRMLGDLGRGCGRASPGRECRGVVELTSDLGVRLLPRQR